MQKALGPIPTTENKTKQNKKPFPAVWLSLTPGFAGEVLSFGEQMMESHLCMRMGDSGVRSEC